MSGFFYSIDLFLFTFLNGTLGNPVFDILMPVITDLNQRWWGWILIGGTWVILLWKGGAKGRTAGLLLIPLILVSDQLSSALIKPLVARARPCHLADGLPLVSHIRLLVGCGGGFSFPSSHAVNNFAAATLFSYFYPARKWLFFSIAGISAFSRISVGVHYPSDVAGGIVIGMAVALLYLLFWRMIGNRFPFLSSTPSTEGSLGQREFE